MTEVSKIEIPVEQATAAVLSDARRREAVGRLVDRLVRPGTDDPLIALFHCVGALNLAGSPRFAPGWRRR